MGCVRGVIASHDQQQIERVRQQKLSELELAESEPRGVAFNRWYASSFPGHVYGRPTAGTQAGVRAITANDIRAQWQRLIARGGLKVVIVGNIDRKGASRILDRAFSDLPVTAKLQPVAKVVQQQVANPIVIQMEQPLATAAFGATAIGADHADYPALQVLRHIIGSGDFDATLMEEIRVKRGLAYAVSVSLLKDTAASILLGGMATKNESMGEALAVLKQVLARTVKEGPTQEQFENAKLYLTGSYLLDLDTNAKLAGSLLGIWREGKRPDFIEKRNGDIERVALDDVRRVARETLAWERFNVTIVGKPAL